MAKRKETRFGVDGDDGGRARTSRAEVFRAARSWPGPRACPRASHATGSPTWTPGGTSRTSPRRAPNPSHPETQTPRAARARELCREACWAGPAPSRPRRTPTASCVRPRSSSTRCGRSWRATGEAREVVARGRAEKVQQRRAREVAGDRARFAATLREDRIFDSDMSRQSAKRVKCGNFARTKKPEKAQLRYRIRGSGSTAFQPGKQNFCETLRHSVKKKRCRKKCVLKNDYRDFRDERRRYKSERRDQTTTRFSRSDDNRCGVRSVARDRRSPRTSLRCHSGLRASPSRRRRFFADIRRRQNASRVPFVKKLTRRARHHACSPPPRRSPRFRPPRAPTSPRARAWLSPV